MSKFEDAIMPRTKRRRALRSANFAIRANPPSLFEEQSRLLDHIAQGRSLQEGLQSIVLFAERGMPGVRCALYLYSEAEERLRPTVAPHLPVAYLNIIADGFRVNPNAGISGRAAYYKATTFLSNIADLRLWKLHPGQAILVESGFTAGWSTPVLSRDGEQVLAVLAFWYESDTPRSKLGGPTAEHSRLVPTLIHLTRLALEQNQMEKALRTERSRLELALEVAHIAWWEWHLDVGTLTSSGSANTRYPAGAQASAFTFESFLQSVHIADQERVSRLLSLAIRERSDFSIEYRYRLRDGVYRWVNDVGRVAVEEEGLCIVGLTMDINERKRAELERAALYAREKRVTETLQRSLLLTPTRLTSDGFAALPGLEVSCEYEGASDETSIGGDFYDLFLLHEDVGALVIGDVTGKGMEAAVYSAEIKFTLRAFLRETGDPILALERLNRSLLAAQRYGERDRSTLAAVCVAVVDFSTGIATIANGGNEPPIVLRRILDEHGLCIAASAEYVSTAVGGLLGAMEDADFRRVTVALSPGDALVLFTDGITEARRPDKEGELFGQEAVAAWSATAYHESGGTDVRRLARALVNAASKHAGGRLHDDACVLAARWFPTESQKRTEFYLP